jgi:hypothetical protein
MFRLFSAKIFIRNQELVHCSKCLHFIEHTNNYPYDPIPNNEKYGRCRKFGEINMITGVLNYDLASHCRGNENKCGKWGAEHEKLFSFSTTPDI